MEFTDADTNLLCLFHAEGRSYQRRRFLVLRALRHGHLAGWRRSDTLQFNLGSPGRWLRALPATVLAAGCLDKLVQLQLSQLAGLGSQERRLRDLRGQLRVLEID